MKIEQETPDTLPQTQELDYSVVWKPIPGTSQELALDSRCHHTLYHGARGPGKTITQIMKFRSRVGIGYGSYWRGIILDREFKNLDDIVSQSTRFFSLINDGSKFHRGVSSYKWTWSTGEELLLRHAKTLADYESFHGHEYAFIGWNELTKHPTSDLYDAMMSVNRSSFDPEIHTPKNENGEYDTIDGKPLPRIPLEVFSTTNPRGPGHNWVKSRFIDPAENGEVVKTNINVFDPKSQKDITVTKTQIAIFGSYTENIYLSPEYVADLESIKDPNQRAAWLLGSWDVSAGGAFDDLWDSDIHIIPTINIPEEWYVDRSFDWGSSHPFSVGWWAESNGEEVVLPNGKTFAPASGSLIQCGEIYGGVTHTILSGAPNFGTNKGLKLAAPDIAKQIKQKEEKLLQSGFLKSLPAPGPADNQIRDVRESDVDTIEQKMSDVGISWTKSDKTRGSRINGFQLLRDRLSSSITGEGPGIYFMNNCSASIMFLPSLPRDSKNLDDVDTNAEDHAYDMIRYRVLSSSNRYAQSIRITFAK